jgi:hypothetical protein
MVIRRSVVNGQALELESKGNPENEWIGNDGEEECRILRQIHQKNNMLGYDFVTWRAIRDRVTVGILGFLCKLGRVFLIPQRDN